MEDIRALYNDLIHNGLRVNSRGSWTKEMPGPVAMQFLPEQWFIHFDDLPLKWSYLKKELLWYIIGDRTDHSICDHAEIWKGCVDQMGYIQSNYGYYFNEHVATLVDIIKSDLHTRRAVLPINSRIHNYPGAPDVPCTMYLNFLVRGGHLHATAHMRSQDAVFGLRNDLPAFQMFKLRVADMLGLPPGQLYLVVDSFHVYQRHWDTLYKVAERPYEADYFPGFTTWKDFEDWLYGQKNHT